MKELEVVLVVGGNGFLGSNLINELTKRYKVISLDNYITSDRGRLEKNPNLIEIEHNIIEPIKIEGEIKAIYHMASPASPVDYLRYPLETMLVNSTGTLNLLNLALEKEARFIYLSTSEVYGDPQVSPQVESYFGNVNPVGPRSVYDEAKRYGEALTNLYRKEKNADTVILRIFNTYGPGMRLEDGRVVPAMINAILNRNPIPIQGDGKQLRSFCYVDDLTQALVKAIDCKYPGPINIGSNDEISMLELARILKKITKYSATDTYLTKREEDPSNRCPDLSNAKKYLAWSPTTSLEVGLSKTLSYYGFKL